MKQRTVPDAIFHTSPVSSPRILLSGTQSKGNKSPTKNDKTDDEKYFLRAEIGMYPDSVMEAGAFISGLVTLRFNPDGTFLTKLDLQGLLPGCTNCGAHVHV